MSTKILRLTVALLTAVAGSHAAVAQGTAFTYQGELRDGTGPANGTYDFQFTVRDAVTGGSAVGVNPLAATLPVSNGRFTVTLDPGTAVFTGAARWLEIAVRTNGTGAFNILSPRQAITATPYAAFAGGARAAGLIGTIGEVNIGTGAITSKQLAPSAVTANKLGADVGVWSVSGGNVFRSNGNVGIGIANPTAALHLNGGFKVNGANALEFGADVPGKEQSAGRIGYQAFGPGALDIVGAGTNVSGRQIRLWAEGGAQFMGPVNAPSANIPTLGGNVSVGGNLAVGGTLAAASATIPSLGGNVTVNGNLASSGTLTAASASIPNFTGPIAAPSATIPTLGGNVTVNGTLTSLGGVMVNGANIVEFGAGVAGKESSAGKIGYEAFGPGALDIVGAGTSPDNRQIRLWAEGGAQFMGPVNAPAANIPTLSGNVTVNGEMSAKVVTITGGSDVAEPYHVAGTGNIEPVAGMVVSIDPGQIGQMRVTSQAYDKTVAGILSGANGIAPGITLRQAGTIADGSLPVASIGRVWCYADADANGPIEAGDLLTTSNTPGHAMKAVDFDRANGAVIGKAMSPLSSGRGLVLVFVSLK